MELLQLIATLLIGLAVGGLTIWLILRGRQHAAATAAQTARREAEAARTELTAAKSAAESARAEANHTAIRVETARAEVADAERRVAEAKSEAAEARVREAEVRSELAQQSAAVAKAQAERDAARKHAEEVVADRDLMTTQFKNTSTELLELQGRKADEVAEKRLRATDEALKPVNEALAAFQERLNQVERERLAMSKDLQAHVQAVRVTGDGLRQETAALVTALRKPQVRGAWGEMQLRRVAEAAGMLANCDFDLQSTYTSADGNQQRPDMQVNLAGGKYVFVDAKVPLAGFLDAQEATDERDRAEALARFGKHLKTHIDQLGNKQYWKLTSGSPEFVVMFLASDAFLQAGLEQVPDLHEYAASRDVVIATPAILIAMLRAIAYGWRQSSLAANAAEVLELGRDLYARISTMGKHFDQVGKSLASTVKHFNSTVATLESRVLVGARRFQELNVSDAELAAVTAREESVRSVTKPELLASDVDEHQLVAGEPDLALESEPPIQLEWRRATMGR